MQHLHRDTSSLVAMRLCWQLSARASVLFSTALYSVHNTEKYWAITQPCATHHDMHRAADTASYHWLVNTAHMPLLEPCCSTPRSACRLAWWCPVEKGKKATISLATASAADVHADSPLPSYRPRSSAHLLRCCFTKVLSEGLIGWPID